MNFINNLFNSLFAQGGMLAIIIGGIILLVVATLLGPIGALIGLIAIGYAIYRVFKRGIQ